MPKIRPEYKPSEAAERILKKLRPEELQSLSTCTATLKAAGIKIPVTNIGKVRAKLLRERAEANGIRPKDPLKHLDLVMKLAHQVGGMKELKSTIRWIEKLKKKIGG